MNLPSAEELQKFASTIKSLSEDEFFKWVSSQVTQTIEAQYFRGYISGFHASAKQKECSCWICAKQPIPEEILRAMVQKK